MTIKHEDASMNQLTLNMPVEFVEVLTGYKIKENSNLPTKDLVNSPRQIEMDYAVRINENLIVNIEFQSTNPTMEDLIRILEYALKLKRKYKCMVETVIVCSADVEIKYRELKISDTTVFRPKWVRFKEVKGSKILNNIKSKIKNNEKITGKDVIQLGLISLYKFDKDLYFEKVLEAAELLFELDNVSKEKIDLIATIQFILADKFFNDEEKIKLGKVLKVRLNLIDLLIDDAKQEGREEGREEGIEEGSEKTREEIKESVVNHMIQNDYSEAEINKITSLILSKF